jgi:arabinofuranosyltransferase
LPDASSTAAAPARPLRPGVVALMLALALVAHELAYGLCVQDDAFISFRYAANLINGQGLVFNPGDAVEGYTNFLWTLGMAGGMALGVNPVLLSIVGGMAASAGVALVAWRIAAVLAGPDHPWLALLAPALLLTDTGLALESVQGLESSFFSMLVGLGLLGAIRETEHPEARPWSAVALALAALTRPEGALAFGLLFGGRLLLTRFRPGRNAWVGAGLVVGTLLAHEALRLGYYGDWVPNTFHAKVGGGLAAAQRGLAYLGGFAMSHVGLSLGLLAGAVGTLKLAKRRPAAWLPLVLLLPWLAYIVTVGGDFKGTWRFVLPLLAPMVALVPAGLAVLLGSKPRALAATAVGLLVLQGAVDLPRALPDALDRADYRALDMEQRLAVGHWLRQNVPPDTLLAIHSAGTIPYASGLPTIDLWGLSDRHIAKAPISSMGAGTAGHEKHDYDYAFGRDPALYIPEQGMLTSEPLRLVIPENFPADFEENYDQTSIRIDTRWLNLWHRVGWAPGR